MQIFVVGMGGRGLRWRNFIAEVRCKGLMVGVDGLRGAEQDPSQPPKRYDVITVMGDGARSAAAVGDAGVWWRSRLLHRRRRGGYIEMIEVVVIVDIRLIAENDERR